MLFLLCLLLMETSATICVEFPASVNNTIRTDLLVAVYMPTQLYPDLTNVALFALNKFEFAIPGFRINNFVVDTGCSDVGTFETAWNNFTTTGQPPVVAVLGEACSSASMPIALLGGLNQIKMFQISPSSSHPDLSNKRKYPYFLRTSPPLYDVADAWIGVATKYQWTRFGVLSSSDPLHLNLTAVFTDKVKSSPDLNISVSVSFPSATGYQMTEQLQRIKAASVTVIFVAAFEDDMRSVLRIASQIGMVGPPYVYVGINSWFSQSICNVPNNTRYRLNYEVKDHYAQWVSGLVAVYQSTPILSQDMKDFLQSPFNTLNKTQQTLHASSPSTYDAVRTIIESLKYMLSPTGAAWNTSIGTDFRAAMYSYAIKNLSFEGSSGFVDFDDKTGDRLDVNYTLAFFGRDNCQTFVSSYYDPSTQIWIEETPVVWPDGTTVPPSNSITFYHISSAVQIAFMTLACVAIVVIMVFVVLTFIFMDHPRIIAATPSFLFMICFSSMMASSIILVIGVWPTNATCVIPHWFGHVAFYITFSCLFLKTWRVWYIFYSDYTKKENAIILTNGQLFLAASIPVIGVMIYLACFTALGMPHVAQKIDRNSPLVVTVYCEFNTNWIIPLYLVEALLLLFTMILIWQTRKIELLRFNESSHIGICIYCLFVIGIILVPNVHWLSASPDTLFVLESVCILIASLTVVFALFIPKFKAIYLKKEDIDQSTSASNTAGSGGSANTGSAGTGPGSANSVGTNSNKLVPPS